ncbi:hypothetical protein, partial [Streptomyces zingiberis]
YDFDLDAYLPTMVDRDEDAWRGDWVPFDPPAGPITPYQDRQWTALDGTTFSDSAVDTHPVVTRGRRFGRMSMGDHLAARAEALRNWFDIPTLLHEVPTTEDDVEVSSEPFTADSAVYLFYSHGGPGKLGLKLHGKRSVWLDEEQGGRYIGGLREVREAPAGHRISLEICYGASPGDLTRIQQQHLPVPRVDDPLEHVSLAQHVANVSGRETEAFNTTTATRGTSSRADSHVLMDTPGGVAGRAVRFLPEP